MHGTARRRADADADALVMHAGLIAMAFGLMFTVAVPAGGRWMYGHMGGTSGGVRRINPR